MVKDGDNPASPNQGTGRQDLAGDQSAEQVRRWTDADYRRLMLNDELERQANDYFDIVERENLSTEQRDRLRRAAIALSIMADGPHA